MACHRAHSSAGQAAIQKRASRKFGRDGCYSQLDKSPIAPIDLWDERFGRNQPLVDGDRTGVWVVHPKIAGTGPGIGDGRSRLHPHLLAETEIDSRQTHKEGT